MEWICVVTKIAIEKWQSSFVYIKHRVTNLIENTHKTYINCMFCVVRNAMFGMYAPVSRSLGHSVGHNFLPFFYISIYVIILYDCANKTKLMFV